MYFRIDTRQRNTSCCICNKAIKGKFQEYCYRVSKNGCGINFCSLCLENIADQINCENEALILKNQKLLA